jgi:AraC-like DNA-binding protein
MLGRARYAAAWKHFERTVPEYILYFMIDGKMILEEDSTQYALSRGDYLLLEPGLAHRGVEALPCEYYYIHFRHEGLQKCCGDRRWPVEEMSEKRRQSLISYGLSETLPTDTISYLPKTGALSQYGKGCTCTHLFEMSVAEYYKRMEQYRLALSNLINLILLELSRDFLTQENSYDISAQYTRSMSKTVDLIHYLQSNYSKRITSENIEDEFEVTFDHLNRTFRRMYGQTIFSYLTQIRISHAKDMISQTELRTSEIAYLVGFEDNSYFTKYFKHHTGMTPSQYWKLSHQDNTIEQKEDAGHD